MSLHLMRPEWLWCIPPALLLAAFLWRQQRQRGSWGGVIDPVLLPYLVQQDGGGARGRNPLPLLLLGWVIAAIAAAGPSWEKIPQPVHQAQDALVLILDLSYSMKAGDLAPSRGDRTRQKILDLLERRREGQTGLIAYAGDSHIVTPLTDDTTTIANLLPALHPDMMPVAGSDPASAVDQALELLRSAGIRGGQLLLFTDGIRERDGAAIAKSLAGSGARLSVMGIGTRTGAPIPLPRGGFVKDSAGTIVMPSLQEAPLRALATATGGRYLGMTIDDGDLDFLLQDTAIPGLQQSLALERGADTWDDKGYLLVLLLLPLALGAFRRGWIACLLPLLLLAQPETALAQSWQDLWLTPDQQGQRALREGDPARAAQLFEDRDWAGTAAFDSGDFEGAVDHFAASDGADAWYNRGNALARAGRLEDAITAYEESLQRKPEREDAQDNLELVKQLLQQQQQEQQQNSGQDEQQDQQSQDEGAGDQAQNQPGQDQQGEPNSQPPSDEAQGSAQQDGENSDSPQTEGEHAQQSGDEAEQADEREEGADNANAAEQPQEQEGAQLADAEQAERDQAMEQWLRRVPDDPSGLLRQKFRYESELRKQQGTVKNDEIFW